MSSRKVSKYFTFFSKIILSPVYVKIFLSFYFPIHLKLYFSSRRKYRLSLETSPNGSKDEIGLLLKLKFCIKSQLQLRTFMLRVSHFFVSVWACFIHAICLDFLIIRSAQCIIVFALLLDWLFLLACLIKIPESALCAN